MCMPNPWMIVVQTSSGASVKGKWWMYDSKKVSTKECFFVYLSLTPSGGVKHPNDGPISSPWNKSFASTKSFSTIVGLLSLWSGTILKFPAALLLPPSAFYGWNDPVSIVVASMFKFLFTQRYNLSRYEMYPPIKTWFLIKSTRHTLIINQSDWHNRRYIFPVINLFDT